MDAVFSIPELAESILSRLDMATLLVSCHRVSRSWHSFINSSVPIQQDLFFHPKMKESRKTTCSDVSLATVNPLLKERFGHCFFETGFHDGYFLRANSFYSMPWTFDHRKPDETQGSTESSPHGPKVSDLTPLELHQIRVASRKVLRKGASWRKMLVCQPPPSYAGYLLTNDRDLQFHESLPVESSLIDSETAPDQPPGLRMGALYDFIQDRAGHHTFDCAWFRVIWGQPREPMRSAVAEEMYRQLLQQTNVVVEIGHFWSDCKQEPRDPNLFDKHFRSKDHRDIRIVDTQKTFDPDRGSGGRMDFHVSKVVL